MVGCFREIAKFARIIRSAFQVVSRMSREDRSTFSDRVYKRRPDAEITPVSVEIDNIETMKRSTNDRRGKSVDQSVAIRQDFGSTLAGDPIHENLSLQFTHQRQAIAMKFLGGLSFATVIAIVSGVSAAVIQLLIFDAAWWRSIGVVGLTVPFSYLFARWKLRRMNLAPDCTWTQFHVATKSRRRRR